MKKGLKIAGLALLVVLVVVLVAASFFLGGIIKTSVNTMGPQIMKVPVTLEHAKVAALRGNAHLKGLVVGNPEGYRTPSAFELGEVAVDLKMSSLASDRIIINRVYIDAPIITFEGSLKGSNISKLMEGLESGGEEAEGEEAEEEAGPEPADGGKKVQINDFTMENAKIKLSMGMLGGKAITIPMPTIHLEDIGAEKDGASATEVTQEIFAALYKGILGAVKSSGALLGKGAEKAGELAGTGAKVAGQTAGKAGELVGDGAGAVGDAAKKTGAVAGDAAKKTGEAVGAGARKLKEGLGGLLKKSDD